MYSVVLLTAMTATAEMPSFGDTWSKHCFWDCCLPARYGWVPCGGGMPYYPTPYYSCHGCGGHHFHHTTCHGCSGFHHGCYGVGHSYGCGCAGYGHGCWSPSYNCYGGGGIYAGIGYAGFGAYGNFGNYGMTPYIGAPAFALPVVNVYSTETSRIESKPIPTKPLVEAPVGGTATINLSVPADAKVFINDYQMKSTSTDRTFISPVIEAGGEYYYTVRVVVERDGKSSEESRRVVIRAGETSRLAFDGSPKPNSDGRALAGVNP